MKSQTISNTRVLGTRLKACAGKTVEVPQDIGTVAKTSHTVGLNYIDTYHRSGLYPIPLASNY